MHYLSIALGLAAAVSAIDIRLHSEAGCHDWSTDCANANPNVCCAGFSSTFRYPSIGFYYVPTSWNLEVRGHGWQNGQYCATLLDRQTINGATNRCLSGHSFAGAGYSFRSKKRADAQACTSTQKADVLTMGNGNRYNITGLRGGQLDELVALAVNGTAAIDVPELFMAFEYKQ